MHFDQCLSISSFDSNVFLLIVWHLFHCNVHVTILLILGLRLTQPRVGHGDSEPKFGKALFTFIFFKQTSMDAQ